MVALALGGKNYPQTPMRVKLGNWVGCASAAAASNPATEGTCQWAGGPANFAQAPFTMYVKSVTIQDYGCATSYVYGDESGSYQSIKSVGGCTGGSSTSGPSSSSSASSSQSSSAASSTKTSSTKTSSVSTTASTTAAPSTSSAASNTSAATTLSSATGNSSVSTTGSPTSSASPSSTPNAASGLSHQYGLLDFTVAAVGLSLGYLVM